MPICDCGCNKELNRRTIQNHRKGHAFHRLVTTTALALHALGPAVSPPRLKPSKKLRSSRRYFPPSPEPVPKPALANDDMYHVTSDQGDAGDIDVGYEGVDELFIDEVGAEHAIHQARKDVWSTLHNDANSEESSDEGEGDDEDVEGEDADELYGDEDIDDQAYTSYGLSGADLLREDFERDAVANGALIAAVLSVLD